MSSLSHIENEFERLVKTHDLTYNHSDDGNAWRRGQEQFDQITALAKQLPRNTVVRIWNKYVDKKIVEAFRSNWYWKE